LVRSQLRQIVWETLSGKNPFQKSADRVAQGEGPDFKAPVPQKRKKKKKKTG
jgi:hypothetical protein